MPGNLLHAGALVQCVHQGIAQPLTTSTRVTVHGQPIVLQTDRYSVAGCTNTNAPCVTADWTVGAVRVSSQNIPVLLSTSQALCSPTASPLMIKSTQPKVIGT